MSFEAIENLNPEELTSLYDDVIEGITNIAQCACGTDNICSYNGDINYNTVYFPGSQGACALNITTYNFLNNQQCIEACKINCQTDIVFWWRYTHWSCNPTGRNEHNPCTIRSGNNYTLICR